jgi:segregation and condensation protein B
MNTADVKRIIEAVLLCAPQPMPVAELRRLFADDVEVGADTVRTLLDELRADWQGRGVELVPLASGWRFQSTSDIARFVERLQPERTPRYSRAVLETLAIIAYRQPVTRGDIEEIRGVSVSAQIVKTLEDRGWIEVIGHKDVVGRPALFATTRRFLDDLSLRTLQELPALDPESPPAETIGQRMIEFSDAAPPSDRPVPPFLRADRSSAPPGAGGVPTAVGAPAERAGAVQVDEPGDGVAPSGEFDARDGDTPGATIAADTDPAVSADRAIPGPSASAVAPAHGRPEPSAGAFPASCPSPVISDRPDAPDAPAALRPAPASDDFQPDP